VVSIIIKIPDHLRIDEVEAKIFLAGGLLQRGRLSLGQAAEFMGLSKSTFMELLGLYGYDLMHYPPEEIKNDLVAARKFCR
jgi:predicted HTH domain antitoxin